MAFLYQDQNQGIRNDAPRGQAAVATVLFHPDSNRRLRNRTESAGPSCGEEGARGLGLRHLYRRWGVPPRPENIYPPGMSGLFGTMANGGRGSKGLRMGNPHVAMPREPDWKRQNGRLRQTNQTRATRIRRTGLARR